MIKNNSIKTIAMYLPQFHSIKENDEWWGKGYTEWTAVRMAESLFDGHQQPEEPLNDNYYNLLDKDTMQWQSDLAKKYGVNGFCFYHYWFGSDRKILEKPAENLLKWKDIDMQFCFCWDSCTWARTWTKIGNAWADKFEPDNKTESILLEQNYGDESFWKEHFNYLLLFFKDDRYIKYEGKPIFLFYTSAYIPCFERMVLFWRELAKKAGFPDLYIIAYHVPNESADAVILPMSFSIDTIGYNKSMEKVITGTSIRGFDYDNVWEEYLKLRNVGFQKTLWCGTVDFDDTPRRGKNGRIYLNSSSQKFESYFARLYQKSISTSNPFIFLDAWNEWGEGKHLEPSKQHGYSYLNAVKKVVTTSEKAFDNVSFYDGDDYTDNLIKQMCNVRDNYNMLLEWMRAKVLNNNALAEYLFVKGFKKIAIYGFGVHGHLLFDDLKKSSVRVVYAIDRCSGSMGKGEGIRVYNLDDILPECDLIIVSITNDFTNILCQLKDKTKCPIVSLSEIVSELHK